MTVTETTESGALPGDSPGAGRREDDVGAKDPPSTVRRSERSREGSGSSAEGNPLLSDAARKSASARIDGSRSRSEFEGDDGDDPGDERTVVGDGRVKDPEANTAGSGPPDGGFRAWTIMLGSFVINGVLFSVINTYSLIYLELQKRLDDAGETGASSKAALVGSLTIGTTFFLSPVAGILTDRIGIQRTTFLGGALASGGMLLSSMLSDRVVFLYLTYGVMYGLGASLAYTPSLVILGHYFKKYLGLVNGIVTAGSSIFTTLIPYLMEFLLRRFGLEGTLRSLAVLTSIVMACAALFKPIPLNPTARTSAGRKPSIRGRIKEVVNLSIWKRKRYVVWASSIPLALFGYFVPYVHIGKFVKTVFKDADGKLPVMCIGITSGIGRLIFGYIADLPKVNRILLQQISFVSIGVLTMLLPVTKSFAVLLMISLCMGLFDGCFISLLGPIAFDICGREGATQAIGFLLGMCSVPLTVGPPIAGMLYDHTGSYDLPFFLAGVPPIVGALTMFLVRCVKADAGERSSDDKGADGSSETKETYQNGRGKVYALAPPFVANARSVLVPDGRGCCWGSLRSARSLDRHVGHWKRGETHGAFKCSLLSESVPLLRPEARVPWPEAALLGTTARSSVIRAF